MIISWLDSPSGPRPPRCWRFEITLGHTTLGGLLWTNDRPSQTAVLWFIRLVAGFSCHKTNFASRVDHIRFLAHKLDRDRFPFELLNFSLLVFFPQMFHVRGSTPGNEKSPIRGRISGRQRLIQSQIWQQILTFFVFIMAARWDVYGNMALYVPLLRPPQERRICNIGGMITAVFGADTVP